MTAAARADDLEAPIATASGDRAAFARFYEITSAKLFGIVRRILNDSAGAEEALQDVYVRIWQMAPGYDATRGRPLAWAATLARYRAIDILRRNAVRDAPARHEDNRPELAAPADGLDLGDREALMQPLRPSRRATPVCGAGLLRRLFARGARHPLRATHRHDQILAEPLPDVAAPMSVGRCLSADD